MDVKYGFNMRNFLESNDWLNMCLAFLWNSQIQFYKNEFSLFTHMFQYNHIKGKIQFTPEDLLWMKIRELQNSNRVNFFGCQLNFRQFKYFILFVSYPRSLHRSCFQTTALIGAIDKLRIVCCCLNMHNWFNQQTIYIENIYCV